MRGSTKKAPKRKPRRIQIVAPHPLAGERLAELIGSELKFKRRLLPALQNLKLAAQPGEPCVFVVDLFTSPPDLHRLIRFVRVRRRGSRFLVVLPSSTEAENAMLRLLHNGVDAVMVLGDNLKKELPVALSRIDVGEVWAPPEVLNAYLKQTQALLDWQTLSKLALTARESQILQLVIRRLSNAEIGEVVGITERTVRHHVTRILGKLSVPDRTGLLAPLPHPEPEPA